MKKIAIVGGGAGGLMSCLSILENLPKNLEVSITLFEKNNSLGKKVILSGGGRCNFTTGLEDKKVVLSKYTRGSDFLKPSLAKYSPKYIRNLFKNYGLESKVEKDFRVFPISDDGQDVVKMFESVFAKHPNFKISFNTSIDKVEKVETGFNLCFQNRNEFFDILIIATGGQAYARTGSSGDGYILAKSLGHTVTSLAPSLNSFQVEEDWVKNLSGLSFSNSKIIYTNGEVFGPFLFTHFGISGPSVFSLASQIAFEDISSQKPYSIKFVPDAKKTFLDWDNLLIEEVDLSKNKLFKNSLSKYLPEKFVQTLFHNLDKNLGDKKMSELRKEDRQKISKLLGLGLNITLIKRRAGDEFVTAGGVSLSEINKKTFESKLCPNLYFVGEVLDVDAVTGGFNLTACWIGGLVVGESVIKKLKKSVE